MLDQTTVSSTKTHTFSVKTSMCEHTMKYIETLCSSYNKTKVNKVLSIWLIKILCSAYISQHTTMVMQLSLCLFFIIIHCFNAIVSAI